MKDFASFSMVSVCVTTLCVAACASDAGPGATAGGVTSGAGSSAPAAPSGPAAGGSAQPSTSSGGSAAGAAAAPSTAPRAGMGATAAGGSGGAATTGVASAAGSGGSSPMTDTPAPIGSFKAAYDMALREMCMGCHTPDALIGSPTLSTLDKAYETLIDKDATTVAPGQCAGMGKLVTPGNCETSLLYNKIAQDTPKCGRHMPLGSDTMPTRLPPAALEAVCAWIKAGAKKD